MYLFEVWLFPWVVYKLFKQLKCFVGIWSRSSGSTLNSFLAAVTDTWEKWITRRKEGFLLLFGVFVSWFAFPSSGHSHGLSVPFHHELLACPWPRNRETANHGLESLKTRACSCWKALVHLFHTIKSPEDQMVPPPSGWVLTLHFLLCKGPHGHTQNSALH